MHGYAHNLPALRNGVDFLASYPRPWQFQLIYKLFEGSTSALNENWRSFAPFIQEKLRFLQPLSKFTITYTLVSPFLFFPHSDASGKVWPKLITTQ